MIKGEKIMIQFFVFFIISVIVMPFLIKLFLQGDLAAKLISFSFIFFMVSLSIAFIFDNFVEDVSNNVFLAIIIIQIVSLVFGVIVKYIIGSNEDKKNVRLYGIFLLSLIVFLTVFVLFMKFLKQLP
ncbi:hypothetical protein LC087_12690 [Bacillus carboniphilus]|uniref:Uncharacterized protein n=1 Tax=Bacillus carboniphilus TaxID=86663 RepID=A0ABY9JVK7_9BACI|nr:hypothetical protein [Bacillus carboniphilus]WLR41716.1 hypothetical protein LC087_12690 [Bacillus carboniphilus]